MRKMEKKGMQMGAREMKYYGMSNVDTRERVFSSAGGLKPNFTFI